MYATSTSCIHVYAIVFSARLNSIQVDQVDKEDDKRTSTYTRLVLSKLVIACNRAYMQRTRSVVGGGLTIRAMPTQLLREKLRSVRRRMRSVLETVLKP